MIDRYAIKRRRVLSTVCGGIAASIAGCSTGDDGGDGRETDDRGADVDTDDESDESEELGTNEAEEPATAEAGKTAEAEQRDEGADEGSDEGSDEEPDEESGEEPDEEPDEDDDDGPGPESVDLHVSDQTAPESFVLDRVETAVDVVLELVDSDENVLAPSLVLHADTTIEDHAIQYNEPFEADAEVTVRLVHADAGLLDATTVSVLPGIAELEVGEILLIDAEPDLGFEYPYFAFVPPEVNATGPVLVEPNNTGTSTDSFYQHLDRAEARVSAGDFTRRLAEKLAVPLLVPVFPRPRSEPNDWRHYVHALDAETMEIESGPLARVDLQLLAMIDHYRASLDHWVGYDADREVLLNGFSASGNFVNRFTALHPDRVRSVTAGGVNGTLILPLETESGQALPYPIGIENLPTIIDSEFDREAWKRVNQFIYIGTEDDNDTIPYDDAWSSHLREIALDVYGEDIQNERMPYCKSVYEAAGANAQVLQYTNVGHQVNRWIQRDIYEFHLRHMDRGRDFSPIKVRDASALEISFAEQPVDGDTTITVRLFVPEYYKIGEKFTDGSVSVMLDTGDEINVGDRIRLSGERHMWSNELPVDETRTYEFNRPLERGEQLTVGLMDGSIITSETVTVG